MKHTSHIPEDFELVRNAEVVCPYCGYVDTDSWEIFEYDDVDGAKTEYTCNECEKEFVIILNVEYSFTSERK